MKKIAVLVLVVFLMALPIVITSGQSYPPGEPYPGQPYSGETFPGPLYPGESFPGQPYPGEPFPDQLYPGEPFPDQSHPGEYSTSVPSGAPVPVAPSSAESLGFSVPAASSATGQAPSSEERGQALMRASPGEALSSPSGTQYYAASRSLQMILPPGVPAFNKFYVPYAYQTTAGCALYGWLPTWMQVSSSGPVWSYEWYPGGWLDCHFLGYAYSGWNKRWFYGDTPGWHILQYYCNGWSNYIYIYVHGWGPSPGPSPGPGPGPWPPQPSPYPWWYGSGMTVSSSGGMTTITSSDGGMSIRSTTIV